MTVADGDVSHRTAEKRSRTLEWSTSFFSTTHLADMAHWSPRTAGTKNHEHLGIRFEEPSEHQDLADTQGHL